jgi:hypothetical protein
MNEAKTRARIKELHAVAIQWAAFSYRAADDGHNMDAVQHMRRANECILQAHTLEQTLTAN